MRNPTYAGEFHADPRLECIVAIDGMVPSEELPTLSIGLKTITHNRGGLKLRPHEVVVIEMRAGNELASFDMPASFARICAARLTEFANRIEAENPLLVLENA